MQLPRYSQPAVGSYKLTAIVAWTCDLTTSGHQITCVRSKCQLLTYPVISFVWKWIKKLVLAKVVGNVLCGMDWTIDMIGVTHTLWGFSSEDGGHIIFLWKKKWKQNGWIFWSKVIVYSKQNQLYNCPHAIMAHIWVNSSYILSQKIKN